MRAAGAQPSEPLNESALQFFVGPCNPCNMQVEDTNNVAGGKASGKHKTVKKKGFCSCFG